jgi:hypothetical protein
VPRRCDSSSLHDDFSSLSGDSSSRCSDSSSRHDPLRLTRGVAKFQIPSSLSRHSRAAAQARPLKLLSLKSEPYLELGSCELGISRRWCGKSGGNIRPPLLPDTVHK